MPTNSRSCRVGLGRAACRLDDDEECGAGKRQQHTQRPATARTRRPPCINGSTVTLHEVANPPMATRPSLISSHKRGFPLARERNQRRPCDSQPAAEAQPCGLLALSRISSPTASPERAKGTGAVCAGTGMVAQAAPRRSLTAPCPRGVVPRARAPVLLLSRAHRASPSPPIRPTALAACHLHRERDAAMVRAPAHCQQHGAGHEQHRRRRLMR